MKSLLLVMMCICSMASAALKTDDEIEKAIKQVLMERHPTDTKEWWQGLGPQTSKIVIRMHESTSNIYHRIRLLQALAWFDDAVSASFVKEQLKDSKNAVVQQAALRTLALSQGDKEVDTLSGYLSHSNPSVRLAAARSLKLIEERSPDSKASAQLAEYRKSEKAGWVLAQLENPTPQVPAGQKLALVSSNNRGDLRSDPRFDGKWKGFWIRTAAGGALESVPAELNWISAEKADARAEFQVASEPVIDVHGIKGLKTEARGSAKVKGRSFGFQFGLFESNGGLMIRAESADLGGVFVGKHL